MMSDIPRLIKHCLNPEWVKLQFKNEDCELLNEYESQNKLMRYKYNDKEYLISWNQWSHNQRPHKREEEIENNEMEIIDDIKEDGIPKFCRKTFRTKLGAYKRRVLNPEYLKHQFKKEDCELLNANEYENAKSKLRYKYIGSDERCKDKDKVYSVSYNNWHTLGIRKHLGDYGKCSEFFKSSIYERVKEIRNNYFHE